jgi:hypothetical protein
VFDNSSFQRCFFFCSPFLLMVYAHFFHRLSSKPLRPAPN